jgi:hypothetical protein
MAERGGQPGNTNGSKSRLFEQAFLREIKQRDLKDGDGETLRRIAAAMIDKILAGDVPAFTASRDTVDGKPAQTLQGPDGGPAFIIQAAPLDEKV